jgi:RNA polymerase sigma factor (sigma-70 family)
MAPPRSPKAPWRSRIAPGPMPFPSFVTSSVMDLALRSFPTCARIWRTSGLFRSLGGSPLSHWRVEERVSESERRAPAGRPGGVAQFTTTHWSLVLAAADTHRPNADEALAQLCERYWYPLYAYVRRSGYDVDEAQDLTQAFFARFLEKEYLREVRPERGRFRGFLLACLKHFLANEWQRAKALKRGGGRRLLPLEETGEVRYRHGPPDLETPERLFERRWALTVLERALDALDRQVEGEAVERLLTRVKPLLAGDGTDESYRVIADELGMTEGAVKVATHRLRRRFAQLVRAEIARTVSDDTDVDAEIRFLLAALGPQRPQT